MPLPQQQQLSNWDDNEFLLALFSDNDNSNNNNNNSYRLEHLPMQPACDMDPKILDFDPDHMFRHLAELIKQKKGGYLKLNVKIPSAPSYFLFVSLVPSEEKVNGKQMPFHPLQLLAARNNERRPLANDSNKKRAAKRKRTAVSFEDEDEEEDNLLGSPSSSSSKPLSPSGCSASGSSSAGVGEDSNRLSMRPEDWRVLLEKKGDEIYVCTPPCANAYQARSGTQVLVKDALLTDPATGETVLQMEKLRLTVIKPFQQQNKAKDGVHIRDVLADIFDKEGEVLRAQGWTRDEAEEAVLKQKKVLLDKARIRIQTLTENPVDGSLNKEGEDVSGIISNKKGPESNQLQIWTEATKMPLYGICSNVETNTIQLVLKRASKGEVKAELVFMQNGHQVLYPAPELEHTMRQIRDDKVRVLHNILVQVTLPPQSEPFMRHLANAGLRLGVTLFRQPRGGGEQRRKTAPVEVPYVAHSDAHCCLCAAAGMQREEAPPLPVLDGVDIPGLLDVRFGLGDHAAVQFDGPVVAAAAGEDGDGDEVEEDGSDEPPFDLEEISPLPAQQSLSELPPSLPPPQGEAAAAAVSQICAAKAAGPGQRVLCERHLDRLEVKTGKCCSGAGAWISDNLAAALRLLLPLVVLGMAFYLGRS